MTSNYTRTGHRVTIVDAMDDANHPATLVVMSCEGPGVAYSLRYPSVSAAVAQLETLAAGTFGEVRDDVTGETYTLA